MKMLLPFLLCTLGLAGCAVQPAANAGKCTIIQVLNVAPKSKPAAGQPDHSLAPPGNQEQFTAVVNFAAANDESGCAIPALGYLAEPTWTVSDPLDVSISSAQDATNGLATCTGATAGAATLTATTQTTSQPPSTLTATTTITCY